MTQKRVLVIGGGLAGTEAAWQLAERDFRVTLFEMRPAHNTGAHVSDRLAELVCSNSLGSKLRDRATGLLQHELRLLKSKLIACADRAAVPAGAALAVDRVLFAQLVTDAVTIHHHIETIREEVTEIPDCPAIIATGPLTSPAFAQSIARLAGQNYLYFYDAISPIVTLESVDMSIAFWGSRYGRGEKEEGDYLNCPMTQPEYLRFVAAVRSAETIELRDFERETSSFFEGCLPIEQLAQRGENTLAFGPMRPKGLIDPHTGKRPYAVVQLRRENLAGSLYNLVGFQTNIRWKQQQEILRLIPGLAKAEFARLGQMHRNTFINSPVLLYSTMQFRQRANLYFAGQITGVEGYLGNVATGIVAAINLARHLTGQEEWIPPTTAMIGALCHYITHTDPKHFQPMKANLGLLPNLETPVADKRKRNVMLADRALVELASSMQRLADPYLEVEQPM